MVRKFPGKGSRKSGKIVEFPKREPFNRKFRKFWDENQMERKFLGKIFFENLGIPQVAQAHWASSTLHCVIALL